MKIEGKNLFTVDSVTGKPEVRPEVEDLVKQILDLMQLAGITEIRR